MRVFCINHQPGPTAVEHDGPVEVTRFGAGGGFAKLDVCPELVGGLRRVKADVLHLQVPNPTMMLAVLAARPRVPLVVTYQSDVIRQRLRGGVFRPLERLAYRRVRAILPTSPTYVPGSRFLRPYADRIEVVPMGIDLAPYRDPSAADRAEADGDPRAAPRPDLAGMRPVDLLQRVPQRDPRLAAGAGTLLIVGDGPDRPELEAEARRLGVRDRVVFLGAMPYQQVVPYYLAAEAFWFPSNARSEAFGIVQVEAMASGCPVINTAIPHSGVAWVSPHGVSGLTVPVDDPTPWPPPPAGCWRSRACATGWRAGGLRRAVAEFDHRVMAGRSLAVYRQVLAGQPESLPGDRAALALKL